LLKSKLFLFLYILWTPKLLYVVLTIHLQYCGDNETTSVTNSAEKQPPFKSILNLCESSLL